MSNHQTWLMSLVEPLRPEDRRPVDWLSLELRLGTTLPSEYKWLVSRYGAGQFFNVFGLLVPPEWSGAQGIATLVEDGDMYLTAEREILREYQIEPGLRLDTLRTCGISLDGDVFYWVCVGETPESWMLAVSDTADGCLKALNIGILELLHAIYQNEALPGINNDCAHRPFFLPYPPPTR